jgi:hypothetical protein
MSQEEFVMWSMYYQRKAQEMELDRLQGGDR